MTGINEILFLALSLILSNVIVWNYSFHDGIIDVESKLHINIQFFFSQCSLIGIILSYLSQLDSLPCWSAGLIGTSIPFVKPLFREQRVKRPEISYLFVIPVLVIFIRAISTYPTNIDALSAHIPRSLFYIQKGSFDVSGSNYWAFDIHPVNFSSIQILFILLFKNITSTQLISFLSFLSIIFQLKIILKFFNISKFYINASVLIFFSSTNVLVSSFSSGNDIYIASQIWSLLSFFILFLNTKKHIYLLLGLLSSLNSIGTKQTSVIPLISISVVLFYILHSHKHTFIKEIIFTFKNRKKLFLSIYILFIGFFIGFYSYIRNYLLFGDCLGSREIIEEHTGKHSLRFFLVEGPKNLIRYLFDFISLDGFYWSNSSKLFFSKLFHFFKSHLYDVISLDLLSGPKRELFWIHKNSSMSEYSSWFGPIGPLFVLPLILIGIFLVLKSKNKTSIVFYFSSIIFLILNSFLSLYETPRCRHFIIFAPIFTILIGFLSSEIKFINKYLMLISPLLIFNIIFILILNEKNPLFSNKSIFKREDWESIIELSFADLSIYNKIERIADINKNIGLLVNGNSVYVFYYGKNISNKVYYYNSWFKNHKLISNQNLDFLFYSDKFITPIRGDKCLGKLNFIDNSNLYCRKMNNSVFNFKIIKTKL